MYIFIFIFFYPQVSSFKCGGYAIGISCSLLLFDPFSMASFLKKWNRIHLDMMISKTDNYNQLPVFYRPKISNRSSRGVPINSRTKTAAVAQTMIFDVTPKTLMNLNEEIHKSIAALCVPESVQKLELKTPGNVSVVVKEPPEVDNQHHHHDLMICKVQNFPKEEILVEKLLPSSTGRVNGITCCSSSSSSPNSNWDRLLGIDGICFREGNKPVRVSCWINSVLDEAFVMIFPSHSQMENENDGTEGLKIIVALPN